MGSIKTIINTKSKVIVTFQSYDHALAGIRNLLNKYGTDFGAEEINEMKVPIKFYRDFISNQEEISINLTW